MEQQGEKVQRFELLKKVSLARLAARHKRLTVALRWLRTETCLKGEYRDQQPWHQTTARKSGVVSRRRYVFLIIQCGASLAEATTGDPSAPCSCKVVVQGR